MTKEQLTKLLDDSQKKNKEYLFALVQIHTNPGWNEKQIRGFVSGLLKESFSIVAPVAEKPKRIRKPSRELEPA